MARSPAPAWARPAPPLACAAGPAAAAAGARPRGGAGGGAHGDPLAAGSGLPVPAAFPRDRSCLKKPEMVELKERLITLLRKQVRV